MGVAELVGTIISQIATAIMNAYKDNQASEQELINRIQIVLQQNLDQIAKIKEQFTSTDSSVEQAIEAAKQRLGIG